ncbi:hypothetical protein [Actinocorallia longicatena]|uniref:Mce-associated membrane protein n=1 Tax=Actinocorallia longicatena TaxID=111803 RepID=A0ABP6Q5K6_9ACTN
MNVSAPDKAPDKVFTRRTPGRFVTSTKVLKAHTWNAPRPAEPETPPPAPRSRLRRALGLIPSILLVAVSVACALLWRHDARLSDAAQQRQELSDSAGKVAGVFFNWDYQHMDQSFAAKYPLLTDAAADAIRPTAATLTTYFTDKKVSSTASITGVYPGTIKGSDANVMVIINTRVTTDKTVQANTGATVVLSMKRIKGRWLAGNITLLSSGVEATTDKNGKPVAGQGSQLPGTVPTTPAPTTAP